MFPRFTWTTLVLYARSIKSYYVWVSTDVGKRVCFDKKIIVLDAIFCCPFLQPFRRAFGPSIRALEHLAHASLA